MQSVIFLFAWSFFQGFNLILILFLWNRLIYKFCEPMIYIGFNVSSSEQGLNR
jgi:hypothetical protein